MAFIHGFALRIASCLGSVTPRSGLSVKSYFRRPGGTDRYKRPGGTDYILRY